MDGERWRLHADEESNAFYGECAELHDSNRRLVKVLRGVLAELKNREALAAGQPLQTLESTVELFSTIVDSYQALASRTLPYELPKSTPSRPKPTPPVDPSTAEVTPELGYTLNPEPPAPAPISSDVIAYKTRRYREKLWQEKMTIVFMVHQLVNDMLDGVHDSHNLSQVFRLSVLFNELLAVCSEHDKGIGTSCKNTCPVLLHPLRKLSITRLLQIIAQRRAECACHGVAEALLDNYKVYAQAHGAKHRGSKVNRSVTYVIAGEQEPILDYEGDGTSSSENENSSIEIYRALAGHITPPCDAEVMPPVEKTATWLKKNELARLDWITIDTLVADEERHVIAILNIAAQTTPLLLGRNGVKVSKNSGVTKVNHGVRSKAVKYYQQVLWGEAGTHMEHYVLWWSSLPFGTLAPDESKKLRIWLLNLSVSGFLTSLVAPAVHNLADGLGCHVTATKWDQLFRHTLVHGQRQGSDDKNKDVGKLFADLLHSLVTLSNDCETTADWLMSPPLEELPLVEQIPILHRLDHSVHTTRLWAFNKAKTLVNTWKVDKFFGVSQLEVEQCLKELSNLKMANHLDLSKVESQHVLVCAKMRSKLTAEVNENISKLKKLPAECIEVMASVCRTFCLANLHMCFPEHRHWRQNGPLPDSPSQYVARYLDRVLKPTLMSLKPLHLDLQQSIGGMTLRILCEAWLDHIYTTRVKFSDLGAMQLLADFAGVPGWLHANVELHPQVMQTLLGHEVLRRCEGVGKLLLRKPGESVNMIGPPPVKNNQVGANGTSQPPTGLDSLPAEMFVPNQQQWLQLRAPKQRVYSLCCS